MSGLKVGYTVYIRRLSALIRCTCIIVCTRILVGCLTNGPKNDVLLIIQVTDWHSSPLSILTSRSIKTMVGIGNLRSARTYFGGTMRWTLWLSLIHISEPTRLLSISY